MFIETDTKLRRHHPQYLKVLSQELGQTMHVLERLHAAPLSVFLGGPVSSRSGIPSGVRCCRGTCWDSSGRPGRW